MKLYSPDITKPTEVNYYWHAKVLVEPMPKPKQGEWIYVTVEEWMKTGRDYGHHCSECDEINGSGKSNYCPNCGAKMKGENDEVLQQL